MLLDGNSLDRDGCQGIRHAAMTCGPYGLLPADCLSGLGFRFRGFRARGLG